ncbi:MAG: rod shape-determining protein MreD [Streptosporangiaceae bacterium]
MRWLISFLAAGLAVIAQVTIMDRITFPGGTGPDLVLLAVVALALAGGPLLGSLIGFSAGLALDVAPPGSHFVGEDALVFCLIGYLCGLVAETPASEGVPEQGHTALFEIVVTAVGAVCGEALMALLGVMVSDPRVTWSAIKHVLPVASVYDVALAPFALYAAAAVLRLAGTRRESRRDAFPGLAAGGAIAGATAGALRPVREPDLKLGNLRGQSAALRPSPKSAPMREPNLNLGSLRGQSAALRPSPRSAPMREPNLNLGSLRGQSAALRPTPKSAPMREPNLKLGNLRGQSAARKPRPKREPNLRLGRGGTLGGSALGAAFAGQGGGVAGALGSPARVRFSSRSQGGVLGGSLLGGSLGGSPRMRSSRFGSTRMGRSLLGGSVFSRSPSALGRPAKGSQTLSPGRSAFLGRPPLGSGWIGRSSGLGRSSRPGPSLPLGRSSSRRREGKLMRSSPGGSAAGHVPRFSQGSALSRLTAALRGPGRTKSAVSRRSLGQSALGSPARGSSGLGRPAKRKLPGRGWLRRSAPYGRGLPGGGLGRSAPRLRIGSTGSGLSSRSQSRLHMPRVRMRKQKSWRTGGYR